jgi:hypothetical protein
MFEYIYSNILVLLDIDQTLLFSDGTGDIEIILQTENINFEDQCKLIYYLINPSVDITIKNLVQKFPMHIIKYAFYTKKNGFIENYPIFLYPKLYKNNTMTIDINDLEILNIIKDFEFFNRIIVFQHTFKKYLGLKYFPITFITNKKKNVKQVAKILGYNKAILFDDNLELYNEKNVIIIPPFNALYQKEHEQAIKIINGLFKDFSNKTKKFYNNCVIKNPLIFSVLKENSEENKLYIDIPITYEEIVSWSLPNEEDLIL